VAHYLKAQVAQVAVMLQVVERLAEQILVTVQQHPAVAAQMQAQQAVAGLFMSGLRFNYGCTIFCTN
jgi:hypothetical protein